MSLVFGLVNHPKLMQNKKILIIDDDPHICRIIEAAITPHGADVTIANAPQEGLRAFYNLQPNLVILDIMMPEIDGWEVCRQIRQLSDVPVIMLTALQEEEDVVRGLNLGAIDYITKPFSIKILLARINAALRQAETQVPVSPETTYEDGYLTIDLDRRRVTVEDELVKLSVTEYRLLELLLRNVGRVMTFEEILTEIWGEKHRDNTDYVRVYVWHLRKKIEKNPKNPQYVLTEYGVGYRFERNN